MHEHTFLCIDEPMDFARLATALLHQLDHTWVVFTSTRSLLNSFDRLDTAPTFLAQADPSRLPDQGRSWGKLLRHQSPGNNRELSLGFFHLLARITPQPGLDPGP